MIAERRPISLFANAHPGRATADDPDLAGLVTD
jgi:hypothetical protein